MPIPPFNFDQTVSPEGAKQDKLEIGIEGVNISGDADDVAFFLYHLGSPPVNMRSETAAASFGRIFNRQDRGQPPFHKQTVRKRQFNSMGQIQPPPVYGGWLKVYERTGAPWSVETVLSLNPTRFVRHQRIPNPASRLLTPDPHFEISLTRRDVSNASNGESALGDEPDNWIPNSRLWGMFASPRFWPVHLENCLRRIPLEAIADIQRAADLMNTVNPSARLQAIWRFNLRSVETYWEFLSDAPLGTVLALRPMLETFSARPVTASDYPCSVALDGEGNSRTLRMETRTGQTLKIYPKTDHRIRFEIVHQLSGDRGFRVPRGGHTFSTIEGVFPLLTHLAAVSAERVNEVLLHFQRHASIPDGQDTVLKFI